MAKNSNQSEVVKDEIMTLETEQSEVETKETEQSEVEKEYSDFIGKKVYVSVGAINENGTIHRATFCRQRKRNYFLIKKEMRVELVKSILRKEIK